MNLAFLDDINWLAVILGALGYFALGAIWYSKFLFAPKWIIYTKVDVNDPNAKKRVGITFLSSIILVFIAAVGIAILRDRLEISGCMSGLKLGTLTGLFFGVTAISNSYLFENRPLGLHLINGFYTLIGNIIAALIICCWN